MNDNSPKRAPRDLRLDALRGLCLVVMTLDHLPFRDNLAAHVTWRPFGFFSAAAVFVLLAGYVASRDRGSRWAWRRAAQLHGLHAALVTILLVCIVGLGFDSAGWRSQLPLYFSHPWRAWLGGLFLIYLPSDYLCILPLYIILFLSLPLLHRLLAWNRGFPLGLLSVVLWLAAQAGIGTPPANGTDLHAGYFNPLAWQLPFVAGLWLGRYRPRWQLPRRALPVLGGAALAFFALRHPKLLGHPAPLFEAPDRLFGPLVAASFSVWVLVWTHLPLRWFDRLRPAILYQALVRLGQQSLPVFFAHQILGFGLMLLPESEDLLPLQQIFAICVTVAVLLQVADYFHLRRTTARRVRQPELRPAPFVLGARLQ